MKINQTTQSLQGTLSNGVPFTSDFIKRGDNFLIGVNLPGKVVFSTSKDFAEAGLIGVQIPLKLLADLKDIGFESADAKVIVDKFTKFLEL